MNFVNPVRKRSVLHDVAHGGPGEVAEFLLMNGASLGARDKEEGSTPLMGASFRGHAPMVETLLATGADLSIRNTVSGLTALDIAARQGEVGVIEVLLNHGADANDRDVDGSTALHAAAGNNHADAIDALVAAGADVEVETHDGYTALAEAAYSKGCQAMLALLQHGATVTTGNIGGQTALHLTCMEQEKGLEVAVDLLLRWGADETALNNAGESPADILGEFRLDICETSAIRDEVEHTRLLLSRAPADRTWRRRGWLVVLRSRTEKTRAPVGCDSDGDVEDGAHSSGGQPEGDGCSGGDAGTGAGAGGVLSGLTAFLVELGPEGVFRTVVGFL